ncbi:MAG: 3-keto-5-aminohexanoate cleavage enzyme [Bacillota bacterium]
MNKLIITAALVGAEVTRRHQPNLPITPEEIAQAAYAAWQAGAAIVHLHVRQPDGTSTQDVSIFQETIRLIQEKTPLVIQVSTGGSVGMSPDERLAPVNLLPEMASLTAGSVNLGEGVFFNPPPEIELFARRMLELGIKPEIEVFHAGMITTAIDLVKKGALHPPLHFNLIMGSPGGTPGSPKDLLYLVDHLPQDSTWSVAGIGKAQLPMSAMAIILGGHVRVGFEDNIYYTKGVLAESNAQLVGRIARISQELGRGTATPDEARSILDLQLPGERG